MNAKEQDLEAQYNARDAIPEHPQILARWARDSAIVCQQLPCRLDLAYGEDPGERLDWFAGEASQPRPLLYFIHGGYWRTLDKDHFAFVVPVLQRLGFDVVLVNYGLCPRISVAEIVAQVRRGLAWTRDHAAEFGGDPDRLFLAGHSAGGHLVAMLMATDWGAQGRADVASAIRGGLAISGLYDLAPLLHTSINVEARLDASSARALSPAFLEPRVEAPLAVALGALESDGFRYQARRLAESWPSVGAPLTIPEGNHFTVLEALADPGSLLADALRGLAS